MSKRGRQYLGILAAVLAYYIVHEGAHFLVALVLGVFRKINFMSLGVQVDVFAEQMTDVQMGVFCIAGAIATFLFAWVMVLCRQKICKLESKPLKAMAYYVTIILLMLDPVYLSVLCGFVGGGDMNGIALLIPQAAARVGFGVIGIVHIIVFVKLVLPSYQAAFRE